MPLRVLVIDDSKAVQAYARSILPAEKYQITPCLNGKEALDYLSNAREDIDLVLLDWEMPIMNGPETLAAFRKTGFTKPIFMVTTKNKPEEIMQMLRAGATDYIMKPYTADILQAKIVEHSILEESA